MDAHSAEFEVNWEDAWLYRIGILILKAAATTLILTNAQLFENWNLRRVGLFYPDNKAVNFSPLLLSLKSLWQIFFELVKGFFFFRLCPTDPCIAILEADLFEQLKNLSMELFWGS